MGGEKRAPGKKVLKDRRPPRGRGRMGTSVIRYRTRLGFHEAHVEADAQVDARFLRAAVAEARERARLPLLRHLESRLLDVEVVTHGSVRLLAADVRGAVAPSVVIGLSRAVARERWALHV
eukprot:30721-Pelagococcus_subviridis.AAC.5